MKKSIYSIDYFSFSIHFYDVQLSSNTFITSFITPDSHLTYSLEIAHDTLLKVLSHRITSDNSFLSLLSSVAPFTLSSQGVIPAAIPRLADCVTVTEVEWEETSVTPLICQRK